MSSGKKILLFDVDGTLTIPQQVISLELEALLLTEVKKKYAIGIVGGSDFKKISYQMRGDDVIYKFDYLFAENGLLAYKNGSFIGKQNIQTFIGEDKLQQFINFALHCLSEITLPIKRGTFIEFRTGLINVCPIGRSCSQEERDEFAKYDEVHNIRKNLVKKFENKFPDLGLEFVIGGQISVDVYPKGWDKTYCLRHIESEGFEEIHFFGDKTEKGGNDYAIFSDPRTIGHTVTSPSDTKRELLKLLGL